MITQLAAGRIRYLLLKRREKLAATIEQAPANANLQQALVEVDRALDRVTTGRYGFCETCNEPIEKDRLRVDPLLLYCTTHVAPRGANQSLAGSGSRASPRRRGS